MYQRAQWFHALCPNSSVRSDFLTGRSQDAGESQRKDSQMARKIALRVEMLEVRALLSNLAYSLTPISRHMRLASRCS